MTFNAKDFLSRCSFCGRDRAEVSCLIVGPEVSICDSCTYRCVEIIENQGPVADDPPTR